MVEFWDIYTADRVETGRVMERGSSFKQGDYHLVVHICLFNDKGEMLIQQRQADKAGWPGLWDVTVGGSALAGETAQQAAMRELEEELGLSLELTGVRPHFTINFGEGFDDTFLVQASVELENLVLQEEEVQAVRWASCDDILGMIDEGSFIPYLKSKIHLCFDMVGQYGAHQFQEK
ncbi:UNVERIFIED_CONTAM: NUDIX domain-containing protein [Streptococcus canis]|uniref:Isopentenyl-diphosphate Delta-isomerase n=1 Tax=Streptococcus canis TaxID=1329 RepID=A0A3P5Y444_STRCB|nr:NUDIX domain-containing protein [Streptococcus canis]MDV5973583.1 NUDIX domain-containing protein [Streptococcus canis]MDV5977938.1 NUDIX domain-containing protein [Streptococcus canis]MDV5989246.1 NUDIX domain-containing protein [Streptococcus canis]MDV5993982.1 NUDIX domain-containing protein [Streptococcus canis]MDV6000252.1 NUDIX domain-containing protein [Streptococcus canis]